MNEAIPFSLEPVEGEAEVEETEVRAQTSDTDVASSVPAEHELPVQVNWKHEVKERNILFVDDDERFLNLCNRRFEASEYSIYTASSADAALAVMEEHRMDIVISDMSMPGKTGAELMHELEKRYPQVIRIIVSGKFDLADTIEAINKGHIYKYITKPFNDKDLKLTIYQALLEKERREAEERRRKERQENVKRRAKQLGEMVVQTRYKAGKAYDECVAMLSSLVGLQSEGPLQIADLAERLASAAGASEADCQQIKVAAILQDLSMVGRPILPLSQMNGSEKEDYFRHPVVSAKLVSEMAAFKQAAFIIKSHHERYDGKGFPCGLQGEEIPWGARVVALATAFENLRRNRNMSHDETVLALAAISERFDPALLTVLADMAPEGDA